MVQTLPSNRAYEPLGVWILPGTSWGCENLLYTQRLDPQLNLNPFIACPNPGWILGRPPVFRPPNWLQI